MKAIRPILAVLAGACAMAARAEAKNVDLATLPQRESVQLTIYNSEDLTLVRETRSLTLKAGTNRIQYSWANTMIDPTSVEIRPLEKADQIEVLDTTYPGDKLQQLVWNIESKIEGQVRFQVTYFTSGLSWAADYVIIANSPETQMSFDGNVQIFNNSGEDYENAEVRLVVGVINLVEKIRELASRGLLREGKDEDGETFERAKKQAVRDAMYFSDFKNRAAAPAGAPAPPEIIKEGLSEYFIYTIQGTQSIPNQTSKRLSSFFARQVKFDIVYRLRPHQYGPRPVRFFVLKNDEEHKLGTTPLPDGLVRTFRDNGRDGLAFLGQEPVKYVPIKADIELNVGPDDEVVEESKCMDAERAKFVFDRKKQVTGWDEKRSFRDEVRNYKAKPVRIEVRRVIDGDITLEAEAARLFDFHTAEFTFDIKAGEKFGWEYMYTERNGTSAKQNAITLAQKVK